MAFVGDPFGEDDDEHVVHGVDIREDRSIFSSASLGESAPSKSSNVSFMKREDLPRNLRGFLIATDTFIVYSVTAKRNLLRAIDTTTGHKTLLRGHESAILDVRVSPVEPTRFCSVDSGAKEITPRVIVWKKEQEQFVPAVTLALPATAVCAHPQQSSLWAITDKRNLAVFSTSRVAGQAPKSYEDLPCSTMVEERESITDIVFTGNGRHLVCAINGAESNAYVQIFSLVSSSADASDVLHGTETLQKVFADYHTILRVPSLLSVFATHTGLLLTLSRNEQCLLDEQELAYELKVWTHDALSPAQTHTPTTHTPAQAAPQFVQSVVVGLPEHKWRASMPSSSLLNPSLEAALSADQDHRFLLLSSRKSAKAAYFALAPVSTAPLPLYHLSLLDLKAPVVSLHSGIVLSRDHHSYEDHEHVEMSIFQEEASLDGQASVLRYNAAMSSLAENYAQYLNPPSPRPAQFASSPSVSEKKESSSEKQPSLIDRLMAAAGASSLSEIQTQSVESVPSILTLSGPTTPSSRKKVEFAPAVIVVPVDKTEPEEPVVSLPEPSAASSEPKKINEEDLFAAKPPATIKATITAAEPEYVSVSTVPVPVPVSVPASVSVSVPVNKQDELPDFLQQQPSTSSKFMSLLRGSAAASVAPTPSNVPEPILTPAFSASLSPNVREEERVKETVSVTVGVPVAKVAVQPIQTQTPAEVVAPLPAPVPVPVSVPAAPVLTTPAPAAVPVLTTPAPVLTTPVPAAAPVLITPVPAPAPAVVDLSPVLSLLQSMQREMKSMNETHQRELKAVREELLAQTRAQQTKATDAVVKAVKSHIDIENKKIAAAIVASKFEVTQQLNETLEKKVLPVLTQKLRESTQNAVKETVKNTLSDSFRAAFDSSLVPAFQAGIDRLFAQVNASFEQGVKSLTEDVLLIHQEHMQSHENLEEEMQNLREDVQTLQDNVGEVSTKLTQGAFSVSTKVVPTLTPMELLQQGKIAEALRAALEAREIDDTVALLSQLTAQQVNNHCPNIIRLCLAQQLAVEMSQTMPKEGLASRVQWIKNLVMSLVRIAPAEIASDAVLAKNFKVMIQAVLESMQAARALIEKAQYDDGEEQTVDIPQSVEVDLELLECVIQNKMQAY